MIKVSVVTTVLNEGDNIIGLLNSLAEQMEKPEEIVVVDAGSIDGTRVLVENWKKKRKVPVKLLVREGANRSVGRNVGIEEAKHELIAVTDAGCVAEKSWLAELVKPFKAYKGVGASAGYYQVEPKNEWEEVFGWYLAVLPEDYDKERYLPSSRSIAFTKEAWRKAGKYPEGLDYCEDLILAERLEERVKVVKAPKAVVVWQLPRDWRQFMRQVMNYASGDMQAGYRPHMFKIATVFGRYFVIAIWPQLLVIYLMYPIWKFRSKIASMSMAMRVVTVQLISDVAVMGGFVRGWLRLLGLRAIK